jgi:hypothetical protein
MMRDKYILFFRIFSENRDSMRSIITVLSLIVITLSVFLCVNAKADLKVFPHIITPGSPSSNNRVFFEFSDTMDSKPTLEIFNINGEKIRDIRTLNPQAVVTGWRLVWDGKDDNGCIVLPGIYLYQWEENAKSVTGAIVVAR